MNFFGNVKVILFWEIFKMIIFGIINHCRYIRRRSCSSASASASRNETVSKRYYKSHRHLYLAIWSVFDFRVLYPHLIYEQWVPRCDKTPSIKQREFLLLGLCSTVSCQIFYALVSNTYSLLLLNLTTT